MLAWNRFPSSFQSQPARYLSPLQRGLQTLKLMQLMSRISTFPAARPSSRLLADRWSDFHGGPLIPDVADQSIGHPDFALFIYYWKCHANVLG